jgi:tyrosyl-tRNA synthetase
VSDAIIDELRWRGLIAQTTDEEQLRADLRRGPLTLYCGFDPTAPSLHIGNLVMILLLKRFQMFGHRPIALVGGATGLVGDPSGRSAERTLNERDTVLEWTARIRGQLERFLTFGDGPTGALMSNNYDWTAPLSTLDFLRDIGKHFSINQMMAKDSVSARLESGGISFTEFSYQVLQSMDYLHLHRELGCRLQIGGSDQWGNITAGLDLIRRVGAQSHEAGGDQAAAHALTAPLLEKADGTKFGKTAGGSIWLDADMTSPYAMYQFWLGSDDRDVIRLLKVFTFLSQEEIAELERSLGERPQAREAARRLAREATALVHGQEEMERAEAAGVALFGNGDLAAIDERTLAAATAELPRTEFTGAIPSVVDLMAAAGLVDSKSAARRTIREGGAYLNNAKVSDENQVPSEADLLAGKYLILRRGKRELGAAVRS